VENERLKEKLNKLQQQCGNAQQDIATLEKTKQQLQDELTKLRRYVYYKFFKFYFTAFFFFNAE